MRRAFRALPLLVSLLALACGDDGDASGGDPVVGSPGGCAPLSERPCPCVYGGVGVQACDASGAAYGVCVGCPPAPSDPAEPGPGGSDVGSDMDAAMPDTMSMPDAGPDHMDGPDAGEGPADEVDAGHDAGLMQAPATEGTSCGVGLPTQCKLESEKCCVRSLMTDTCIGMAEACECPLRDCDVMEATCDGPEDCPDGQVCCGTLGGNSYSTFACASNCDYAGSQRIACHQDEGEPCPAGNVCANSQLLTNLQVCIDPSTIQQ